MDPMCRKRNASDGDSGFDSALSSRSSSISLDQESPEFGKPFFTADHHDLLSAKLRSSLRADYQDILGPEEDIQREDEDLLLITNTITGAETLFKPPTRLKFSSCPPQVATTYSPDDYDRNNSIPRSALFHARLEYELEKQIEKMDLVPVDLVMASGISPPPSLGIRVIGVNMIHGVPDKLNIYVKRVVEDSVAGADGRILVNDHIVEVNGVSLVGVSQKLAAQTLSNCAICPETGTVHFVLARPRAAPAEGEASAVGEDPAVEEASAVGEAPAVPPPGAGETSGPPALLPPGEGEDPAETSGPPALLPPGAGPVIPGQEAAAPAPGGPSAPPPGRSKTSQSPDSFLTKRRAQPEFVGRDAVRLATPEPADKGLEKRVRAVVRLRRATLALALSVMALAAGIALVGGDSETKMI